LAEKFTGNELREEITAKGHTQKELNKIINDEISMIAETHTVMNNFSHGNSM
jgi:hypothetical protein